MQYARKQYMDQLIRKKDNRRIKVITGLRRSGKSYLLFTLYRQYLLENGVLELHDVYLLPDELTARKMSEKELAENQTSFRCSLYDDLTISLEEVFRDLF